MRIGEWLKQIGSEGIEGLFAHQYDRFARSPISMEHYRMIALEVADRVQSGKILEIGPGPGYIAIEIAKLLPKAENVGLDVSRTMVGIATRNATEAGVVARVSFRQGNAAQMPFPAESFDFVVSSGSLHHWKQPIRIFNEICRVLKDGGEALVGDLRRDAPKALKEEMAAQIDSRFMRWGLMHSFSEAHTRDELMGMLAQTRFSDYEVTEDGAGLSIRLKKALKQTHAADP
jgi:ubiquinone/menaquinone biosynthesis C-methylase UbiE